MLPWLHKSVPFGGSALFRGTFPLQKENFQHVRAFADELRELDAPEGFIWGLELNHPVWGQADLFNSRNIPLPPHTMIDWDPELTPAEAEVIKTCGTTVQFAMKSNKNNILRDRKNALHYLNAILGEEGVAAIDHVAQKIWPRDALAIETAHDADLDVDGVMTYHWVTWEDRPMWLHSHGLAEIGCFDFDILNPNEDLQSNAHDLLRAIAFKSVEGELKPGASFTPLSGEEVRAVSAEEFMAKAAPEHLAMREGAEADHAESRVVLCDPKAAGLRAVFGGKPLPSQLLSAPYDESRLIQFSTATTEMMSHRAQATFELFTGIMTEIEEFDPTGLVKLGYKVDDAKEENDREHMWFQFHGMSAGQIDATLVNQPFHIASMKEGNRGPHSQELLTDWTIFTPAGKITPAFFRSLRLIRQNKEALRQALKEAAAEPGN